MRSVSVVESTPSLIELSPTQARTLQQLGFRLASRKGWWGKVEEDARERSVIRCRPDSSGLWEVRVSDAVGLVSIGDLQLLVEPKIPVSHLLYLFAKSGAFPRLEDQRGLVAAGASLWELVATWFVSATERVLRRDLVRDYQMTADDLVAVRGTVGMLATARHYYGGRLRFECTFEEFGYDSPLNRAIRAASHVVSASPQLSRTIRRRALALIARMDGWSGRV